MNCCLSGGLVSTETSSHVSRRRSPHCCLHKLQRVYVTLLLLNVSLLLQPLPLAFNVQLEIMAFSCLSLLCVSVFCFGADCLSVCFSALSMSVCPYFSGCPCQCQTILCLRAAHLGSHHSHGSRQCCLCLTAPHQSDCSQLRQSPSVLLPLH